MENKFDMKQKYFELLKSGGNGYPLEILNKVKIDFNNDEVYAYAFNDLKNALNEIEKLI